MARHYVKNPRASWGAVPDSPAALAEFFADERSMQHIYGSGVSQAEFHRAYLNATGARDGGVIEDQLREQADGQGLSLASLRPRSSALQALYRNDAPAAGGERPYSSIGEMFRDVRDAARRPGNGVPAKLNELQNSYGTDAPSDGGFLVPEEWRSDAVLSSLESAIIRPRALVLPMTTQRLNVPIVDDTTHASTTLGGITTSWTDEGTLAAESSSKVGNVTLDAKKLSSYVTAPNELVNDSRAFSVLLSDAWPKSVAWAEDDVFIAGNGSGQPLGLLNAGCAIAVTRATSSHVKFADLIAMQTRLLPQSYTSAIWLVSPDVVTELLNIFLNFGAATTGVTPPPQWLDLNARTLLGRPFYATEHVPKLGTAGDVALVDPSFYVIGDRLTASVVGSPHAAFSTDKTVFRLVHRVDGRPWLGTAVTPKNGSQTVSPIVTLN